MASKSVRESLAKDLLKGLSAKENRETRKALQSTRPHVLFLENLDFINDTIVELKTRGHLPQSVNEVRITQRKNKSSKKYSKTLSR